ncbi:MAG TPA: zinc-binding dehydrogenase [Mycobacteriales bacterium]|nr:zinc-binding dehydrogenase [Mycobacteriales bacterium]
MRALVLEAFGTAPLPAEVPDPEPPEGGVVVAVEATGMCRSDWHAVMGHDSAVALPHVPGHELSGRVVAVGAGVRRWSVGDLVTTPFVCGCGRCGVCAAGNTHVCPDQQQPGFTHWGSFAELVALHAADTNLVGVPDGLDVGAAATLGCRFATAYRAVRTRAGARSGEWVAVLGCGGVGLSAVLVAVAAGARVVAVDVSPDALAVARSLGAEVLVDGAEADVPAAVHEATRGGAHVAVDALGSPGTCRDSVLSLRRRGRQVQVGLLPPAGGRVEVPMERVIAWELDLLGSHGMPAADYPAMLADVASGLLDPGTLVHRQVSLAALPAELMAMGERPPLGVLVCDPRT